MKLVMINMSLTEHDNKYIHNKQRVKADVTMRLSSSLSSQEYIELRMAARNRKGRRGRADV